MARILVVAENYAFGQTLMKYIKLILTATLLENKLFIFLMT